MYTIVTACHALVVVVPTVADPEATSRLPVQATTVEVRMRWWRCTGGRAAVIVVGTLTFSTSPQKRSSKVSRSHILDIKRATKYEKSLRRERGWVTRKSTGRTTGSLNEGPVVASCIAEAVRALRHTDKLHP